LYDTTSDNVVQEKKTGMSCILDHGNKGVSDDRVDCEWEFAFDLSEDDSYKQENSEQSACTWNCHVCKRIIFLGYHPYKEIAFLGIGHFKGYAYYMGTTKLMYLGSLHPAGCPFEGPTVKESFIYTPCRDDLLPTHDESTDTP
jgi:hypothetical protein